MSTDNKSATGVTRTPTWGWELQTSRPDSGVADDSDIEDWLEGAVADNQGEDASGSDDSSDESSDDASDDSLSDYERLRLERIKRNQAKLDALGLGGGSIAKKSGYGKAGRKRTKKAKKGPPTVTREYETRSRNRAANAAKRMARLATLEVAKKAMDEKLSAIKRKANGVAARKAESVAAAAAAASSTATNASADLGAGTSAANGPNKHTAGWESSFAELLEYKRVHGDCLVKYNYEANPKLARWVKRQRYWYKKLKAGKHSQLTEERVQKLADAGFVFSLQLGK